MNREDPAAQAVDDNDKAAYTINEWCFEARVSPALYFKEKREGRGPRVAHMGRRAIIVESPRAYYKRIERAAAKIAEAV
jgi:hypothetical protein